MVNIRKHSGFNIGGINPVRFVFIGDILTYEVDPSTLSSEIVMRVEPGWNYLYCTDGTISLEADEPDTAAGTRYDYKIKFLIPKDRPEVERLLKAMNNRGFLAMIHDKNGVGRIFGTLENPMRKRSRILKPGEVEGFNGWEVTFYGSFAEPAAYTDLPYVFSPDEEDPGGGGGD